MEPKLTGLEQDSDVQIPGVFTDNSRATMKIVMEF